eukprot:3521647-Prymnesium_polylepis.2
MVAICICNVPRAAVLLGQDSRELDHVTREARHDAHADVQPPGGGHGGHTCARRAQGGVAER